MRFNEHYFRKASDVLEQRRMANSIQENTRRSEVIAKIPEYIALEARLADTSKQLVMILLKRDESTREEIAELERSNLAIQQSMNELLTHAGFPADYLEHIYTCPKCKDKGTVNGSWCSCFQRIMLDITAQELNSVSPLELCTFDSFSLDYYSNENDPKFGASPRMIMSHNLDICRRYAEEFTPKSGSLLLTGGTGLGKTHLSLAVADMVIRKGYNVIYGSVPELLRIVEREIQKKTDENTMEALSGCDLLILDDLGAETDRPMNISLIYEIINTRLNRSLPMIINTNISGADMKNRYPDRICSRIFAHEVLIFAGQDIRIRRASGK